jgi:hypothetical protein
VECGTDAVDGCDRGTGIEKRFIDLMIEGKYRLLRLQNGPGEIK